ncbi:MAG: hypothetical protein ACRDMZ_18670 [Solirubrobacteraceae bacterium]
MVEVLRDAPSPRRSLLSVRDVAARLRASADYVRSHADELGAVRLPGALLRFDPAIIDELSAASARCSGERSHPAESPAASEVSPARRRRRSGAAPGLLPIKGAS